MRRRVSSDDNAEGVFNCPNISSLPAWTKISTHQNGEGEERYHMRVSRAERGVEWNI